MASGGARAISGPAKSPTSGRSDRAGVQFTALPAEGYAGEPPVFPLPPAVVIYESFVQGEGKVREVDEGASASRREREAVLWEWVWSTPQAAAWALEPWRWHSVAMWVRTAALCESADATAADKNSLHRFAEDIGLSVAGMVRNGWVLATPQIVPLSAPSRSVSSRDRVRVVK